jgi:hypothetical protein
LVTANFNRAVSNLSWQIKKPGFEKQRSLVINYGVAQSADWSEPTITERAKKLAAAAARLWPAVETLLS